MSGINNHELQAKTNGAAADGSANVVGTEMERILAVAGIESSLMDPSSAQFLRDLIAQHINGNGKKDKDDSFDEIQNDKLGDVAISAKDEPSLPRTAQTSAVPSASTSTNRLVPTEKAIRLSAKKSLAAQLRCPPVEETSDGDTETKPPPVSNPHLDAALNRLANNTAINDLPPAVLSSPLEKLSTSKYSRTNKNTSLPLSSQDQLRVQQKLLEDQSEAIRLLTAHIRDLTNTVHTLQDSVDLLHLRQNCDPILESSARLSKPPLVKSNNDTANSTPVVANNDNAIQQNYNTNHNQRENNDELRRAHLLAHHVAWRIATFPMRAVFFYVKYEYRVWLVLLRQARRDVLNPFREAGMIFQLGFALIIVYGRIAPAIENAMDQRRREYQRNKNGDNDDYYGDDFLDDADFQIHTLATAIMVGFLYHVGVMGLLYRFFVRDRWHLKIWKDLREGVELTPNYGLDLDLDRDANGEAAAANGEEQERENNGNQNQGHNANENNNLVANGVNNNIPRPPNRNVRGVGPAAELFNNIGNGVNDFFMGHGRRRRAVQRQERALVEAQEQQQQQPEQHQTQDQQAQGAMNDNENRRDSIFEQEAFDPNMARNPIVGLLSDILCLFYSFFVSILPIWNYEQQLRDMRDEGDRIDRLRNQHQNDQGDSDEDNDDEESNESSSSSDGSESDSDSE